MSDKITFENGFFMAPNDIFDCDLKLHDKIVYLYLCRCGNNSTAFPSYNTIAKKCSISRRKAIDVVEKLQELELIKKQHRKKDNGIENNSNVYQVVPPNENHKGGSAWCAPSGESHAPCSAQDAPNKELDFKELKKNKKKLYIISSNDGPLFSFYEKMYQKHFGKAHLRMTEEKLKELQHNYDHLTVELDINDETWELLVKHHFDYLLPYNDGNILNFLALNGGYGCVGRYLEEVPYV